MMTPASADVYASEKQRDLRAEAAAEALARRLAPGPLDRLRAALRSRHALPAPVVRPAVVRTVQPVGR